MFKRRTLISAALCAFSLSAFSNNELVGFHDNAKGSPIFQMLDSAQQSVRIEIYEMEDTNVHAAIRNAIGRGVKVDIVQEPSPMGARCKIFSPKNRGDDDKCANLKNLVHDVNVSGGSYKAFDKKLCGFGHSCFQHGKTVIVDGNIALVSTGNFNSTNLCDLELNPEVCNRDYSMVTNDPQTVAALVNIFDNDLRGEKLARNQMLTPALEDKMTVSPVSLNQIIAFIRSATKSIRVQNQYLHEPEINAALVEMAQKGKDVQVTVSSLCWFERPKPHEADRATVTFSSFDRAGISTKFFTREIKVNGKPGYLHAKAIVVDAEVPELARAWVGSMNGSTESAKGNREYGLFFRNPQWINELVQITDADHNSPGAESWRESLQCLKDRK